MKESTSQNQSNEKGLAEITTSAPLALHPVTMFRIVPMKMQFGVLTLVCAVVTSSAFAQTVQECLQSFAVKSDRSVGYIAVDPTGQYKVTDSMKCSDAERFRERLFLSMDQNLFDSEQILRTRLTAAEQALSDLETRLQTLNDKAQIKGAILGAVVVVNSTWAIATAVSCGSGLLNGAGLAACGPAMRAAVASTAAWYVLSEYAGSAADMKTATLKLVAEQRQKTGDVKKALNAATAASMKENRTGLFLAVCRAVKQQCM